MLEELAAKINKKWTNYSAFVDDNELVVSDWKAERNIRFSPVDEDAYNSRFIIWGLDRLEELGGPAYMFKNVIGTYTVCDPATPVSYAGKTRAEAVANALLESLRRAGEPGE